MSSLGLLPEIVKAQLIPDDTLGAERSQVFTSGIRDQIQGGAIRGGNLFHSFSEFNVGVDREVYISNPGIRNIITRVTGGNPSNILGRLGVIDSGGVTNLFLINPNGIIFSPSASLDVSNSFTASTASAITFDGSVFGSAQPANNTLLKVNTPTGLQRPLSPVSSITNFGDLSAGFSINLEAGQIVNDGKLSLDRPDGNITLTSYEGNIDVKGSVSASKIDLNSEKDINVSGKISSPNYDVDLISRNGVIRVSGDIEARNINLESGGDIFVSGTLQSNTDRSRNNFIRLNSENGSINIVGSILSPQAILESNGDIVVSGNINDAEYLRNSWISGSSTKIFSSLGNIKFQGSIIGSKIDFKSGKNIEISGRLLTGILVAENDRSNYELINSLVDNWSDSGVIELDAAETIVIDNSRFDMSTRYGSGDIRVNAKNFISNASTFFMGLNPHPLSKGEFNINVSNSATIQNSQIKILDMRGGAPVSTPYKFKVDARNISMDNSSIELEPAQYGGSIHLNALQEISLINKSLIDGSTDYRYAGDIFISAPNLYLSDASKIESSFLLGILVQGKSGAISISSDNVVLREGSAISVDKSLFGFDRSDDVSILEEILKLNNASISLKGFKKEFADSLVMSDGSYISAQILDPAFAKPKYDPELDRLDTYYLNEIISGANQPVAAAGEILIKSKNIELLSNSSIKVNSNYLGDMYFGQGDGFGIGPSAYPQQNLFKLCNCSALEIAGKINIVSDNVSLFNKSSIIASANNGVGGNISISGNQASLKISDNSKISAEAVTGEGGRIVLSGLNDLNLKGGSSILASAKDGKGGDIRIDSQKAVNLNSSKILAVATGTANAGNLDVTTELLTLNNQSQLAVSSQGSGAAGNLTIQTKSLNLDTSQLIAETANGQGGNIEVNASDIIQMRRNNLISTTAGSGSTQGDGGNITITTPFLLGFARGNSDIVANAFTGSGGQIKINAEGTLNIISRNRAELAKALGSNDPTKLNPNLLSTNDVTAISQANPNLNGTVNFNALNLDPGRGLATDPVAPANPQIVQDCRAQTQSGGNKFVNSRRGGTPPDPNGSVTSSTLWQDDRASPIPKAVINQPTTTISEAQGWKRGPNNTVLFTTVNANRSTNLPSTASRPCYAN
jgi:filamentous hemagglutinin family protein